MTIKDFYQKAFELGTFYKQTHSLYAMTMHTKDRVLYNVSIFNIESKKHIESGHRDNPEAALEAFKDALDFHTKTYSKEQKDMEI